MYFNNRPTARENEIIHLDAIANTRTFEEHQMATAMFLKTFINNHNTNTDGWTQNQLLGYLAPETRRNCMHLDHIIAAVRRTLEGCGPQTAAGEALIMVDARLHETDSRFSAVPVGAVAMFRGVLDSERWGLSAGRARKISIPGYFLSPEEFVVVDPIMAGSYLQGVTRWHGGEDTVGHLRQHGENLKLINRPLSETYALVETYHEHPDKNATLWLHTGMRFELRPALSSLSRILTPPEDTKPQVAKVTRTGSVKKLEAMLDYTKSAIATAWAMTDLPARLLYDSDYPSGMSGGASVLNGMLAHDKALCINKSDLMVALAAHKCQLLSERRILGRDGVIYNFDAFVNRHNYTFTNLGGSPLGYGASNPHCSIVLAIAAFMQKNNLPNELFLGLLRQLTRRFTGSSTNDYLVSDRLTLKLPIILNGLSGFDFVRAVTLLEYNLEDLAGDYYTESRLARTRATYHDGLNTKQRKKLLEKFYPLV
jgi:hypothetical protein